MRPRPSLSLLLLWIALLLAPGVSALAQTVTVDDFQAQTYDDGQGHTLPYRLFIPSGYDPAQSYPLVLFFSGTGGRGSDNRAQLTDQPAPLVFVQPQNQASNPCFMLAPQCPADDQWVETPYWLGSYSQANVPLSLPMRLTLDLLDALQKRYSIDASRIYVTGLSIGGYGTWDAIERRPYLFAAAVPMCGAGDPSL